MDVFHDPTRQIDYLRQSLGNDRTPLGFLLGAGCPLSVRVQENGEDNPIIPGIVGLTEHVCTAMRGAEEPCCTAFETLQEQFVEDDNIDANIEDILSRIRALQVVAGKGTVRGLTAAELSVLDDEICKVIVLLMSKSLETSDTPYHKMASWIGSAQRILPVQLFTLNYDLLLEQALEEHRVAYFDGFIGSCKAFFDIHAIEMESLPPRWARLWKLHGSINWRVDDKGTVFRSGSGEEGKHHVIHPSHLKYEESRRMPYLVMIDQLRVFLREPSAVLIVSGYSFGDEHLNEVMIQGLQGNPTAAVVALMFGPISQYQNAIDLSSMYANLSVLSEDEAILGKKRGTWISKAKEDIIATNQIGIHWGSLAELEDGTFVQPKFQLGDFSELGRLIEDVVGMESDMTKDVNAK